MARKFLYLVAALIVLVLLVFLALRLFPTQLSRWAFVPTAEFTAQPALKTGIYDREEMWIARPGMRNNPALWRPNGLDEPAVSSSVAVFFVHPTSYLPMMRAKWNAPLDDPATDERTRIFVRGQASVFNASPLIWAPKYRQAAFGAFLSEKPEGRMALDAAYRDVLMAFDAFLKAQKPGTPIILAGHSQGSLHLVQLLKDRVAGTPLAKRIVAVYPVGWPISIEADLPALGLPVCTDPDQTGCIMTWSSFAEPADTAQIVEAFEAAPSLSGKPRTGGTLVCTNPLTGGADEPREAGASANLGTLKNEADFSDGTLIPQAVGARCDDKGFLMTGEPVDLGPYVLPGNNYHVYDYSLFWANVREDVARRTRAFLAR